MIANLASALRSGVVFVGVIYLLATLTGLLLAVLVALFAYRMARAGLRFRGRRVVRCPETHDFAAVSVDAPHAAFTAAVGDAALRLNVCVRGGRSGKTAGRSAFVKSKRLPKPPCFATWSDL